MKNTRLITLVAIVILSFASFGQAETQTELIDNELIQALGNYSHSDCWLKYMSGYAGPFTGTNPSTAEIFDAIRSLSVQYKVPIEIIGAVCYQESGLYQYGGDGFVVHNMTECVNDYYNRTGPKPPGLGLMQLTGDTAKKFNVNLLITDWRDNLEAGVNVLRQKYDQALSYDPPSLQRIEIENWNVLENWRYALAFYNGYQEPENPYVNTVCSIIASPPSRLTGLFTGVTLTRPQDVITGFIYGKGYAVKPEGSWLYYNGSTYYGTAHTGGGSAAPAPSITSVSPTSMPPLNGNQAFTIYGNNFQNGATLIFVPPEGGTIPSTASKLTFVSSSQINYQFNNANDSGNWSVKVINPDGQSSNTVSFTVVAGTQVTAAIDEWLLDLIDEKAPLYFDSAWNLNISQFKTWVATIAWAEGGAGGYGAHSSAVGTDMFYHIAYPNVVGGPFKFSTGVGPFQLDSGQPPENWQNWPTIDKLTPSLSVQSVLRWHNVYRGAGSTLAGFAANSPWVAVRTPSDLWEAVTGTSWDAHKNGNVALDWNAVRGSLSQNAAGPSYRYNYSVESKGTMQWNIKASENVRTETGKLVVFDGGYSTWLVRSRKWDGTTRFGYYYACRRDIPVEVCVLDNESDPVNVKFKYIFIREWSTSSVGQNPDHVAGIYAGEPLLTSPAITLGGDTGMIRLTVNSSSGSALPVAEMNAVLLFTPSGTVLDWKEPPSSNPVDFTGIAYGDYYAFVFCWDMLAAETGTFTHNSSTTTRTATTRSKRPLTVTVYRNDGSTPLSGATVYLDSRNGQTGIWTQRASGTTDASGQVTITAWPTTQTGERYQVRVNSGGSQVGSIGTVTVADSPSGSSYSVTTTVTATPSAPTANAASGETSSGFTANWSSASGATGYRLDVSTSSTFSSFLSGYNNLDVGNVLSRSVSGLSAGTTYYYRVRAYNAGGTSGNSATISVTTQSTPVDTTPPTVAISSPTGGQAFTSSPITVSGTASDPASPSSGLALVEVRVKGGSWQTASGTTSWNRSVSLASGSNTIEARSRDNAGNYSTTASVTVTYTPPDEFWKSPTATGKNDNEWTNPTYAYSSDDNYSTATGTYLEQDYYNFNFGLPSGATPTGIQVKIEGHGWWDDGATRDSRILVYIWSAGNSSWGRQEGASWWAFDPDGDITLTKPEGTSDLWGTVGKSDFDNENFKLRIATFSNSYGSYIDWIQVKVYYYTEPPPPCIISGYVRTSEDTGISGVTMSGLPGNPTTNGDGYYSDTVDHGWSGTVTPTKSGYTFDPSNRPYTDVTTDQTAQNYTGTLEIIGDFCGANFGSPDGYVDVWDLMQFADHWHTRTGDANWDTKFNLTGPNFGDLDGYVDVWDLMVFADNWHEGEKP